MDLHYKVEKDETKDRELVISEVSEPGSLLASVSILDLGEGDFMMPMSLYISAFDKYAMKEPESIDTTMTNAVSEVLWMAKALTIAREFFLVHGLAPDHEEEGFRDDHNLTFTFGDVDCIAISALFKEYE